MYDVGYNDPQAFRATFSKIVGMRPFGVPEEIQ